jgi:inhibitor of cysteine peptidase
MVRLNEASAGQPVTTQIGERVHVSLPENATTGYRWRIAGDCDRILALEDEQSSAPAGPPGAGGTRYWVFMAKAEGTCTLRFESKRSWEKDASGKAVAFPITVRKA